MGYRDGYFSDEQSPEVAAAIRDSGAQLLFVAMSTPRKEHWLGEYGPGLNVPFVMGVGGAIDIVAGITRRAPRAWQRLGIEWLYRVFQEPRRMFRRYLVTNTKFGILVTRAMVARGRSPQPRERVGRSVTITALAGLTMTRTERRVWNGLAGLVCHRPTPVTAASPRAMPLFASAEGP